MVHFALYDGRGILLGRLVLLALLGASYVQPLRVQVFDIDRGLRRLTSLKRGLFGKRAVEIILLGNPIMLLLTIIEVERDRAGTSLMLSKLLGRLVLDLLEDQRSLLILMTLVETDIVTLLVVRSMVHLALIPVLSVNELHGASMLLL